MEDESNPDLKGRTRLSQLTECESENSGPTA
jgi:hypothetical protein